ncbi:MAG: minor capsid protein [Vagococcus sp.]|uniref:minor capsid protein n=1 Tax=Vagococcus sp. TaxID=1933889 RepID=UPI002FC71CFA
MSIQIDLSNVYKKLSDTSIDAGRRAFANQALIDTNENFVPRREGNLRQFTGISTDGTSIFWYSVYARKHFYAPGTWNYTTPGTGPRWTEKGKGIFISDWVDAFVKGARW